MDFRNLAPELNSLIAIHLDDRDLCSFARICHETHDALNHPSANIWRVQFTKYFDLPTNRTNDELKAIYQYSKKVLRNGAHFKDGKSRREKQCLDVLKILVVQSFGGAKVNMDSEGEPVCRNLGALKKFVRDHDILRNVMSPRYAGKTEPLLLVLQVMLCHLQLDLDVYSPTWGFPDSQKAVYATAMKEPIFKGSNKIDVNMEFVAHTINFFKYHMTRAEEQTLYNEYKSLHENERPRALQKKLTNGAHKLGKSWKGIYSYLELAELTLIRRSGDDEAIIMDNFSDEQEAGVFQTMDLEFVDEPLPWPSRFEYHLQSRTHPSATYLANPSTHSTRSENTAPRTRAQHRRSTPAGPSTAATTNPQEPIDPKPLNFHFVGTGIDAEHFLASGWLNPLPAQHGIPGWMRWTMMKFFVPDADSEDDADSAAHSHASQIRYDPASVAAAAAAAAVSGSTLWAYEGVVLPGGQVVVGRWWGPRRDAQADEDSNSGPFMFWCVDE